MIENGQGRRNNNGILQGTISRNKYKCLSINRCRARRSVEDRRFRKAEASGSNPDGST